MDHFAIRPDDCLTVLAISDSSSIRDAAKKLRCDPGGLLRKVQRIANEHGFLKKVGGRWVPTERGLAATAWVQESILSQKKILLSEKTMRVASSLWFAERVLMPQAGVLGKFLGPMNVQMAVPEAGFERTLFAGDCDFVISCHPPDNPSIAHRRIVKEPWSLVVAPALARTIKASRYEQLLDLPFVRHKYINPDTVLKGIVPARYASVSSDDFVTVRSAIVNKLGWGCVPSWLVREEVRRGYLTELESPIEVDRSICVWWLRDLNQRKINTASFCEWVKQACAKA